MKTPDVELVTLALDCEGGDNAPGEVVAGGVAAASAALRVLLVGRPEVIEALLGGEIPDHLEVVPSTTVISSHEEPALAVRSRTDSSIVVGATTVATGRAQGLVSAGSTGAIVAAGLLVVKRVPEVRRPAILAVLPGLKGPVVLLDAGANAECRPQHLLEFAHLGAVFARRALGVDTPRIGLLNIGEERTKGNDLALEAHALLAASGLDFAGNVEGREVPFNAVDVVVTDGFTGNVALKAMEGTARSVLERLRESAGRDARSRLGAYLLRPAMRDLRRAIDPEEYGGTYLLGLRGLLVICHGNSSRKAITNALHFAALAVRQGVVRGVEEELIATPRSSPARMSAQEGAERGHGLASEVHTGSPHDGHDGLRRPGCVSE